jgi:predicted metal-dependent peptidase
MVIKNIHEKLMHGIKTMLVDSTISLVYYGNFNLGINFHERENIGTCAVNVTPSGMNFYYSTKFLNRLSQKEVNFIILHENFHLLFDHPKRTISGNFDHKLANIVQDMIINHIICEDISNWFVEIPKSEDGKNMALFVPAEYNGKLIFEELYEWMRKEKEEWEKGEKKTKGDNGKQGGSTSDNSSDSGSGEGDDKSDEGNRNSNGNGSGDGNGNDSEYGPYGKNPKDKNKPIETWSKEKIFRDLEEGGDGQYLDSHIGDEVPSEMREGMLQDTMDRLKNMMESMLGRGIVSGDFNSTISKLRKKRKDYLREIKKSITNIIFGTNKQKTIIKPNRKGIPGLKGSRKTKTKINVILDVSGSMYGLIDKVLSYVYRNDIEINLIQADTKVNSVTNIKNAKSIEKVKIVGLGGTILQPAVDYTVDNFNNLNTVILTDGYCDSLDLRKLKGRVLIISAGIKVGIKQTNNRVRQIIVDQSLN